MSYGFQIFSWSRMWCCRDGASRVSTGQSCGYHKGQRIVHHCQAGGQVAEQFAVGLNVDSVFFMTVTVMAMTFMTMPAAFLRQPADDFRAADQIDAVDIPLAAEQRSRDILQIGIAAGGAAHDGAQIAAVERSSGDQFAQDVSEKADSHRQEFRQQSTLPQTASVRVLGLELAHAMRRPQMPG